MSRHTAMMLVLVAAFASAALIVPTTGVAAQSWTTVTRNGEPMVEGSGRVAQQSRAVGNFSRVETAGSYIVEVRFGARPSLVISGDDNILPLVTTGVRNGTLELETRGSFRTRSPIRVSITTPRLEAFQSSGSGSILIDGVSNERLALTLNGSGDIRATGRTGHLDLKLHGSGRAQLEALSARNVEAGLYGSGTATVRASGSLDAGVYGSGTLRYLGTPANVRRQNFGSGRIIASR